MILNGRGRIPRGGGTPNNGLYGEALPKKGAPFSRWGYIKGWGFHELKTIEKGRGNCHLAM